jgi:hypothetical protein
MMMFWPIKLNNAVRAVDRASRQLMQSWKDREFPDVTWENIFYRYSFFDHFSNSLWGVNWWCADQNEYTTCGGSIWKGSSETLIVKVWGGQRDVIIDGATSVCDCKVVYRVNEVNRSLVFTTTYEPHHTAPMQRCKRVGCSGSSVHDRTWVALAFRMLLAPMYVCGAIDMCKGVSASSSHEDELVCADSKNCVIGSSSYIIELVSQGGRSGGSGHNIDLDREWSFVQELLDGKQPSPWANKESNFASDDSHDSFDDDSQDDLVYDAE